MGIKISSCCRIDKDSLLDNKTKYLKSSESKEGKEENRNSTEEDQLKNENRIETSSTSPAFYYNIKEELNVLFSVDLMKEINSLRSKPIGYIQKLFGIGKLNFKDKKRINYIKDELTVFLSNKSPLQLVSYDEELTCLLPGKYEEAINLSYMFSSITGKKNKANDSLLKNRSIGYQIVSNLIDVELCVLAMLVGSEDYSSTREGIKVESKGKGRENLLNEKYSKISITHKNYKNGFCVWVVMSD